MKNIFSVEEAIHRLLTELSESTGWKYLKSQRCLKKTVQDLVFEINFFSSKWNVSYERIEVNAEFTLWCKSYGKSSANVNNVIATMSYRPEPHIREWFDISTEKKSYQYLRT